MKLIEKGTKIDTLYAIIDKAIHPLKYDAGNIHPSKKTQCLEFV